MEYLRDANERQARRANKNSVYTLFLHHTVNIYVRFFSKIIDNKSNFTNFTTNYR